MRTSSHLFGIYPGEEEGQVLGVREPDHLMRDEHRVCVDMMFDLGNEILSYLVRSNGYRIEGVKQFSS
jgi:hypothetical protein